MAQNILVLIIGILAGLYVLRAIYGIFCKKKGGHSSCDQCPGCILHPKKKK